VKEKKMSTTANDKSRSFSAYDHKGNEVKGTVVFEDSIKAFALVEENDPATGPCLWLVDTLEDTGVSLDVEQVKAVLPHMRNWVQGEEAENGGPLTEREMDFLWERLESAGPVFRQRVIDALHAAPLPAPDAEGEWRQGDYPRNIFDARGNKIATAESREYAAQIVRDHNRSSKEGK
jgi:hypothetical protein